MKIEYIIENGNVVGDFIGDIFGRSSLTREEFRQVFDELEVLSSLPQREVRESELGYRGLGQQTVPLTNRIINLKLGRSFQDRTYRVSDVHQVTEGDLGNFSEGVRPGVVSYSKVYGPEEIELI